MVLGWFSKEAAIQSISINGNTDFSAEDSFYYDAEIIIVVHEQKQNDLSKAQAGVVISLAKVLGCEVEDLIDCPPLPRRYPPSGEFL